MGSLSRGVGSAASAAGSPAVNRFGLECVVMLDTGRMVSVGVGKANELGKEGAPDTVVAAAPETIDGVVEVTTIGGIMAFTVEVLPCLVLYGLGLVPVYLRHSVKRIRRRQIGQVLRVSSH